MNAAAPPSPYISSSPPPPLLSSLLTQTVSTPLHSPLFTSDHRATALINKQSTRDLHKLPLPFFLFSSLSHHRCCFVFSNEISTRNGVAASPLYPFLFLRIQKQRHHHLPSSAPSIVSQYTKLEPDTASFDSLRGLRFSTCFHLRLRSNAKAKVNYEEVWNEGPREKNDSTSDKGCLAIQRGTPASMSCWPYVATTVVPCLCYARMRAILPAAARDGIVLRRYLYVFNFVPRWETPNHPLPYATKARISNSTLRQLSVTEAVLRDEQRDTEQFFQRLIFVFFLLCIN